MNHSVAQMNRYNAGGPAGENDLNAMIVNPLRIQMYGDLQKQEPAANIDRLGPAAQHRNLSSFSAFDHA